MSQEKELNQITYQLQELHIKYQFWKKKYNYQSTNLTKKLDNIFDPPKIDEIRKLSLIPLPDNLHMMKKYVISFKKYSLSTQPQIGLVITVTDTHLFNFFGFSCLNLHFLHPKYNLIKNLLIKNKDKDIFLTTEVYYTTNSLLKFMIKSVKDI